MVCNFTPVNAGYNKNFLKVIRISDWKIEGPAKHAKGMQYSVSGEIIESYCLLQDPAWYVKPSNGVASILQANDDDHARGRLSLSIPGVVMPRQVLALIDVSLFESRSSCSCTRF